MQRWPQPILHDHPNFLVNRFWREIHRTYRRGFDVVQLMYENIYAIVPLTVQHARSKPFIEL